MLTGEDTIVKDSASEVSKIRVAHLVHSLGTGGMENGVVNLLNNIDPKTFSPYLITLRSGGELHERVDLTKVKIIELNKKSGNDFALPLKLYTLNKKHRFHIMHTHSWGTLCEGIIAAKLAGCTGIVHGEHGTIQKKKGNRVIQRFFWNKAHQVLSVSKVHRTILADVIPYPIEKIKVIQNGVDVNKFSPSFNTSVFKKKFGLNEKNIVIGSVGRLEPVKNYPALIQAFSQIRRTNPYVRLVFVGDGSRKAELKKLVSTIGIEPDVLFLGSQSEVQNCIRAMDIFVLPSESEGLSNTLLESMSCGISVVATKVGGNPELIDKSSGVLVPPNNVDALVIALQDLIENPSKRQLLGKGARDRVTTMFSIQSMVKNYEDLYIKICNKNRPNF
ncbi:MAG: glycosyltransferase [Nitrospinota bacterium]